MLKNRRLVGFAAFTAIFAVLAAIVFWGTWSLSVAFIAPDDGYRFSLSFGDTWLRWWNQFSTTGKAHPLDILWSGLLGSPMFTTELRYVVPMYLSSLALAFFLHGRGLSLLASYGAGLLLGFSGYWCTLFSAGHGNWFVWMSYGPFAFGLVDRALERGNHKYWLLLGLVMAWASFYMPDLWLLFTVFTAAYFVFRLVQTYRSASSPAAGKSCLVPVTLARNLALVAVVFFAVGAPSFYSALTNDLAGRDKQVEESKKLGSAAGEDAPRNGEDDARWIFVTNWSLPPAETLEFLWPRLNGDTSCPLTLSINAKKGTKPYTGALGRPINAPQGNYRQHSLYVGWVTIALALLGVLVGLGPLGRLGRLGRESQEANSTAPFANSPIRQFANSTILFFAIAALVFWLFSLGRYCEPVYRCVYALPFGNYLRAPVKWHHLTEFCLCVLAGYGIEALLRLIPVPRAALGRGAVAALILFGAFDLATEAHRFCAPVDYSKAVAKKCSAQLTVLPRQQFNDPQVATMVRAGYIVSVANWLGSPDAYLVQVLQPMKPAQPATPKPLPLSLGVVSVLAALATLGFTLRLTVRRDV